MKIFHKTLNYIALALVFNIIFPLGAVHLEKEKERDRLHKHFSKNRVQAKIIKLKNNTNTFLDIPTTSYAPIGNNDLIEIDAFNPSFSAPVVTFHYSQLNNGSAFFTFQVPDDVKKKDVIALDLVFLTQSSIVPIEGRVAIQVHFDVVKKDGIIDRNFTPHHFDHPWLFNVSSASAGEIAKTFKVKLIGNKTKLHPGDIVIVTLTRVYKVPENFPAPISLLSTRITTNTMSTESKLLGDTENEENTSLGGTPGPTNPCKCPTCLDPACVIYECSHNNTYCPLTKYKVFTKKCRCR